MSFVLALLINLLLIALVVVVVLWVVGMFAEDIPAKALKIIKAIVILIALLYVLDLVTGGGYPVYPLPHRIP